MICGYSNLSLRNHKRNKFVSLKFFSITNPNELSDYNDVLLLLRRMTNVEELGLQFLTVQIPIIDGYILKQRFIGHMSRLNKFTFNIGSFIYLDQLINLPSSEDIQKTIENFQNNEIISSVSYFLRTDLLYCHVYSYPYAWTFYHNVTNNFPGGLFKCVREISLNDERPFEHDFFLGFAQSFPFIEKLT